jgi:RNA polymerase sigma-70 factor (ECF subfamily)
VITNPCIDELAQGDFEPADYQQFADETLMQRYALGDIVAFETLYQRHKAALYRYFMRQIPNHTVAEDLYQDIWSKVIVQARQYQSTAKFTTWLYTLAHNKLVDHIRHLSVVNKVIVAEEKPDAEGDAAMHPHKQEKNLDDLANSANALALKHCIKQLPQAQKDSFLLKEEAGLSVKDITLIIGSSFEASKSRLRYAYENLRQCLSKKMAGTSL